MNIRQGSIKDLPFLKEMLFEAFFWNPKMKRPDYKEFLEHPEFKKLLSNWGRTGDEAVIAEPNSPVGAAWYRFWTKDNHSYGFVDSDIPELGIAVKRNFRSQGIGKALMREIIDIARNNCIKTISLSVDPNNYACTLYKSVGFIKVGEFGTSWTFLLNL